MSSHMYRKAYRSHFAGLRAPGQRAVAEAPAPCFAQSLSSFRMPCTLPNRSKPSDFWAPDADPSSKDRTQSYSRLTTCVTPEYVSKCERLTLSSFIAQLVHICQNA